MSEDWGIMSKPLIRLWEESTLCLVIPWPSGVRYSNQTRGHRCWQEELEGVCVPVGESGRGATGYVTVQGSLETYFNFDIRYPGSGEALTPADADLIDKMFQEEGSALKYLSVDRIRIAASYEAWVWVVVDTPDPFDLLEGFQPSPFSAVLTWPNSD